MISLLIDNVIKQLIALLNVTQTKLLLKLPAKNISCLRNALNIMERQWKKSIL